MNSVVAEFFKGYSDWSVYIDDICIDLGEEYAVLFTPRSFADAFSKGIESKNVKKILEHMIGSSWEEEIVFDFYEIYPEYQNEEFSLESLINML